MENTETLKKAEHNYSLPISNNPSSFLQSAFGIFHKRTISKPNKICPPKSQIDQKNSPSYQEILTPSTPGEDWLSKVEDNFDENPISNEEPTLIKNMLQYTNKPKIVTTSKMDSQESLKPPEKKVCHIAKNESLETEIDDKDRFHKEGYLLKKFKTTLVWEKYYFEVDQFRIYYAYSKEEFQCRKNVRCINLLAYRCKLLDNKGVIFSLSIEEVTVLHLRACCEVEADAWRRLFKNLPNFLQERYLLDYKLNQNLKQFSDILVEEEFLETVETGDILLLKTENFFAKMQRLFTYSDYDHLAMMIKVQDDVYLYDSNNEHGVQMTKWEDFKNEGHYKGFSMMAYRKLNIPDISIKDKIKNKLWDFITMHVGKKYELSVRKLFRRPSFSSKNSETTILTTTPTIKKELNEPSDKNLASPDFDAKNLFRSNTVKHSNPLPLYRDTEEGFFCSELVAAAYKSVELLDSSISSTRYLPVSFSQRKGLNLLKGASLSCEYGLVLRRE